MLPTIKECNYTKIFACRKWEEGHGGNVKLSAPASNSNQCALQEFVETVKPGSTCSSCSILLGRGCVPLLAREHNTLSHYKYMPAVLHNWIKREATVPQNKKAVRLMRTRSGSERYRIVPVSISCLFFLWVTPKNIG